MADSLKTTPLRDVAERITKGTTPTTLGYAFRDRGVNFIKSEAITSDGFIDESTFAFIDEDAHKKLSRSQLQEGDILFSMAGIYLGKTAVVKGRHLPANTNQAVGIIRPDRSKSIPRFVHYSLSAPRIRAYVRGAVAQSAQPNFNLKDIGDLPIPAFSLSRQEKISDTLGALDDKIELNRRFNRMMQRIARAIFKAWFIDFDAVKAKADGAKGFHGMSPEIFDQLPDRLTDTDYGSVPEGWRVGVLGDVVRELKNRVKPSPETRLLPYVPIDCITSKSIWLEHSKSGDEAKSSLVSFDEDDILFGAMRPYFHKVCLAPFAGTTRTTVFILQPKMPSDLSFSLMLLSEKATIDYATQHSVGSTIPYAKWDNSLATMPIVCPPPHLRECYHHVVWPMLELLKQPYFENRVLGAIRDALLPKLISGEIRLTEDGEVQHGG